MVSGQLKKFAFQVTGTSKSRKREASVHVNRGQEERTVQLRNSKVEAEEPKPTYKPKSFLGMKITPSSAISLSSSLVLLIVTSLWTLFL